MSRDYREEVPNVKLAELLSRQDMVFVISRFSRFAYLFTRISLRILVGKEWRTRLLQRYWPRGDEPPAFFPTSIRKKLQLYEVIKFYGDGCPSERKVRDFISNCHGNLFVDVGANLGYYTRLCARTFKAIIAIEADPEIAQALKSRLPPNAELINVAISDRRGNARFHIHNRTHWGTWLIGSLLDTSGPSSTSQADTMNVATITLAQVLGDRYADLVKVDVEGAEWLVLEGADPVMSRIESWIIELHDLAQGKKLFDYMRDFGYSGEWLDDHHVYFRRA